MPTDRLMADEEHEAAPVSAKLRQLSHQFRSDTRELLEAAADMCSQLEEIRRHNDTTGHGEAHFCTEWDGLYICEDCPEFRCCTCLEGSTDAD